MSHFRAGSPEEEILDQCLFLQEQGEVSNNQIILALAKVMQYFAEISEEDDNV